MQTNVRQTSITALRENRIKLGHSQKEVYRAFLELGPTHDCRILEYLRQREKLKPKRFKKHEWENSNICGRRNQLMRKNMIGNEGLIVDLGSYHGQWNGEKKTYHFWAIRYDDRPVPSGWVKAEDEMNECPYSSETSPRQGKREFAETLFS